MLLMDADQASLQKELRMRDFEFMMRKVKGLDEQPHALGMTSHESRAGRHVWAWAAPWGLMLALFVLVAIAVCSLHLTQWPGFWTSSSGGFVLSEMIRHIAA